jgi:hypothetical protein
MSEDNWKVLAAPVILSGQIDQLGTKGMLAEYTECSVPSSELGPLPTHFNRKRVMPSPFGSKAEDTLAGGGGGGGRTQFRRETGILVLYTLIPLQVGLTIFGIL